MIILLPVLLILMVYAFLFPRVSIYAFVIFQALIDMEKIWEVYGFGSVPDTIAILNQVIMLSLVLRNVSYGLGKISRDGHSKTLSIISGMFLFVSFSTLITTEYLDIVVYELGRLVKFLFMVYALYFNIENTKQMKVLIYIMAISQLSVTVLQVLFFILTGNNIVVTGDLFILPFFLLYITNYHKNPYFKTFFFLALFFIIANIVLVSSRRSVGILMVSFMAVMVTQFNFRMAVLLIIAFIPGYLTFEKVSNEYFFYRVNSIRKVTELNEYYSGREKIWVAGWLMVQEAPFFGKGFGVSKYLISDYAQLFGYRHVYEGVRMHNTYLKAWSEVGIVGALLFLAMMISMVRALLKITLFYKRRGDTLLYYFYFAMTVRVFAQIFVAFFGWGGYYDKEFWFWLMLTQVGYKLMLQHRQNSAVRQLSHGYINIPSEAVVRPSL